ncbi:hypothetical protein SO802_007108 [Lithocarpus litseifolius]|uniref:Uncharacterized protein n=1 Tax=Lithocarpus litseifolius TaxID=425828 RepID=A0AAW2DMQ3_9ROSI
MPSLWLTGISTFQSRFYTRSGCNWCLYSSTGKEEDIFFIIKAFAAGVILATGFIHIFPDAFENLELLPCLSENPWGNFPFTGFVAMVSAIGTLMVEAFATSYYERSRLNNTKNQHGMDYWRCREVWNSWSCSWILFFNWLTIRLHRFHPYISGCF